MMYCRTIVVVTCTIAAISTSAASAQPIPSQTEFDTKLNACAREKNVGLDSKTIASISSLYPGDKSRQIFNNRDEFLSIIPPNERIDAYKLYTECILLIVPQFAITPSPVPTQSPQQQIVTRYLVCTGEYERACLPHEVYLYCYADVKKFANDKCPSNTVTRLNTYGGNKCGYSLDEIICTWPN